MDAHAAALAAQHTLAIPAGATLEVDAIRGGLESAVALVRVRARGPTLRNLPQSVIVKELLGSHRREAEVYQLLGDTMDDPPIARVFGHSETSQASYLCLEHVRRASAWPWRDQKAAEAVGLALARVHHTGSLAARLPAWPHEETLRESAEETLRFAMTLRAGGALVWGRPAELQRVIGALPRLREQLLSAGTTVIHGDVHPGNVLVRAGSRPYRVVLIDWARARIGSPLEDIASWLHSLGCWDLEARRRHDSLFTAYLRLNQPAARLEAAIRANYWIASACNGLRGAICYHIAVLTDPRTVPRARRTSRHALNEWQRVVRGAAAVLSR
jgi:aminoglycoside phosphotransferase (APT) family kinase protein